MSASPDVVLDPVLDLLLGGIRQPTLPALPIVIATRLGLQVRRGDTGDCLARWDVQEDCIVIPPRSLGRQFIDGLTGQERFSVAHEIGHYLVRHWPHVLSRPSGRLLERTCDRVAARLLLPEEVLTSLIGTSDSLEVLLDTLQSLVADGGVSPQTAAIRIRDHLPGVSFAQIHRGRGPRYGDPLWSTGHHPTIDRVDPLAGGSPALAGRRLGATELLAWLPAIRPNRFLGTT